MRVYPQLVIQVMPSGDIFKSELHRKRCRASVGVGSVCVGGNVPWRVVRHGGGGGDSGGGSVRPPCSPLHCPSLY